MKEIMLWEAEADEEGRNLKEESNQGWIYKWYKGKKRCAALNGWCHLMPCEIGKQKRCLSK